MSLYKWNLTCSFTFFQFKNTVHKRELIISILSGIMHCVSERKQIKTYDSES